MTTVTHKPKHDVTHLEARVTALKQSLAQLSDDASLNEFLEIIHKPGHTTVAEIAYEAGIVEVLLAQSRSMAELKNALLNGARAITAG